MSKAKVLIACEFSGIVRNAFLSLGFDAYSCDLLPGIPPKYGRHIRGDVRPLLKKRWDLIIAHPPCTYLTNTGARWFYEDPTREAKLYKAVDFFIECLEANSDLIAVENPRRMFPLASKIIGPPTQVIQPYNFGHAFRKETGLWLKGVPELRPTNRIAKGRYEDFHQKVWATHNRKLGKIYRSMTFHGIAKAMAEQWGELLK